MNTHTHTHSPAHFGPQLGCIAYNLIYQSNGKYLYTDCPQHSRQHAKLWGWNVLKKTRFILSGVTILSTYCPTPPQSHAHTRALAVELIRTCWILSVCRTKCSGGGCWDMKQFLYSTRTWWIRKPSPQKCLLLPPEAEAHNQGKRLDGRISGASPDNVSPAGDTRWIYTDLGELWSFSHRSRSIHHNQVQWLLLPSESLP